MNIKDAAISGHIISRGLKIPIVRYNTVVIGSGAAGLNAADSLYALGVRDVAIITEDVRGGTSRNAGSDKQTYYKLSLGGAEADSVRKMAETFYGGGCVDGDLALCEAGLSAECFFKLVSLGVPFPRDRYGAWAGYKTDHDPARRATSAGPYTSKLMAEKLQAAVESKGIPIYGDLLAIAILTDGVEAVGVLCLDLAETRAGREQYAAFCSNNVILATGGPAGLYKDVAYPKEQRGANGIAFEAGAAGANLTEWQYGLASLKPRWNVSGTYMQALPRFISTEPDGSGAREFLSDYYASVPELLTNVFLKGYQWPFDIRKASGGSSLIDLCVFNETLKGRKVFLDYRENPLRSVIDYGALGTEAREYLEKAHACFGTPYKRLLHMNAPAVDFYLDRGVDLSFEPLEIALCAQHNNGGVAVDKWWQTSVGGLFAVGEAAGTHGVRRPGGSALNAGQAGSLRAAQYIAAQRSGAPLSAHMFKSLTNAQVKKTLRIAKSLTTGNANEALQIPLGLAVIINTLRDVMSKSAGAIRNAAEIKKMLKSVQRASDSLTGGISISDANYLPLLYILHELCVSQAMYLTAFADYIEKGGKSRGSSLYTDEKGALPHPLLPDVFKFQLDSGDLDRYIQEIRYAGGKCTASWRETRPIPSDDDFFENVWRDFRAGRHID